LKVQLHATTDSTKLNPAQLEILRLFNRPISDTDLEELRQELAQYLLERERNSANKAWDENGFSDTYLTDLHERTP
jgi:hypothetical protein